MPYDDIPFLCHSTGEWIEFIKSVLYIHLTFVAVYVFLVVEIVYLFSD